MTQIWWKALIYTSEKFNKAKEGWPQRDLNTDTSQAKCWKPNMGKIWKHQEKNDPTNTRETWTN